MTDRPPGRPRDTDIDRAVLAATLHHLSEHGFGAMSLVTIAADADTTRQAIYRRWRGKAELAVAAIASLPEARDLTPTGNHHVDLLAELIAFHRGVLRRGGISMVGTMLQDGTDPALQAAYRERIVAARRLRLRRIISAAVDDGTIAPDSDIDLIVASCTGTLYAQVLAGEVPSKTWPERMVRQVLGPAKIPMTPQDGS